MTRQIAFVGFDGGSCSTLSLPVEIFTYAISRMTGDAAVPEVSVVTASGGPLQKTGFFSVMPTARIEDLPAPELIFLTGMDLDIEHSLQLSEPMTGWLRAAYVAGSNIAAVCPSQGILASAGLLDGKPSSIHWSLFEAYKTRWPEVDWRCDDMVSEQDRIFTCCGGTASTDLALYLVHYFFGEDIMLECARWFLTEVPRTRRQTPPPLFEMPDCTDPSMKKVQSFLHAHFADAISFDVLATEFGMSPRTFYRRFQSAFGDTPRVYLQKLRLAAAKRLLETENYSVEQVACAVGYENAMFFRELFKRHTHMTPKTYQEKFRFKSIRGEVAGCSTDKAP